MIADDIDAIRAAMRKLSQAKLQAEAEAARRAANDTTATTLPQPKPLFSESAPPFRGFFLTKDGKPDTNFDHAFDQAAWDEWDDVTLDSGITGETAPLFFWGKID